MRWMNGTIKKKRNRRRRLRALCLAAAVLVSAMPTFAGAPDGDGGIVSDAEMVKAAETETTASVNPESEADPDGASCPETWVEPETVTGDGAERESESSREEEPPQEDEPGWDEASSWEDEPGWDEASSWEDEPGWEEEPPQEDEPGWDEASSWEDGPGWDEEPSWEDGSGWDEEPSPEDETGWDEEPSWEDETGWDEASSPEDEPEEIIESEGGTGPEGLSGSEEETDPEDEAAFEGEDECGTESADEREAEPDRDEAGAGMDREPGWDAASAPEYGDDTENVFSEGNGPDGGDGDARVNELDGESDSRIQSGPAETAGAEPESAAEGEETGLSGADRDAESGTADSGGSESEAGTVSEESGNEQGENEPVPSLMEDPDAVLPSERVGAEDLSAILGEGICEEIAPEIDAVREILDVHPDDEGILQLAAEAAGKTEEAAEKASEVMEDPLQALPEETAEAVCHAGYADEESVKTNASLLRKAADLITEDVYADEDRQNGRSVSFVPSDKKEDAMAYLSSFVLSDVRDGAGDFDDPSSYDADGDGYDWRGNDSDDHNGVIRTGDELTYVFSYATALQDAYIYNTIHGTRLYVEYILPMRPSEAEFNIRAMPWLKGDGDGGAPVLTYLLEDGSVSESVQSDSEAAAQRLVGYRELPDREDPFSGAYDVPGAGTLNCIISIKRAALKQDVIPSFRAWLQAASGNDSAPGEESGIVLSPENPKGFGNVRVTLGPYVTIRFPANNFKRCFTKWGDFPSLRDDGSVQTESGRIKQIQYEILVGKPNGAVKGVDALMPGSPVTIEMTLEAESTLNGEPSDAFPTSVGLYDLRTASMVRPDKPSQMQYAWNGTSLSLKNVITEEVMATGYYSSNNPGGGTLDVSSVRTEDGVFRFSINGSQNTRPGEMFAAGDLLLFQKMAANAEAAPYPHYTARVCVPRITATAERGDGQEVTFSQAIPDGGVVRYPTGIVENTIDSPGTWDSHVATCVYTVNSSKGITYNTPGLYATSGTSPYGAPFNVLEYSWFAIKSDDQQEHSRKEFILFDNRKIELDLRPDGKISSFIPTDSLAVNPEETGISNGMGFMDGTVFDNKFRIVFLTKKDGSLWRDEDEMRQADLLSYRDLSMWPTYLEAKEHGEICGVCMEIFNYDFQTGSGRHAFTWQFSMKPKEDLALIGQSAMITRSIISYRNNVTSSCAGPGGQGTIPLTDIRRKWYIDAPRTYEKSEWDEHGQVLMSSLTEHNHPHEGTTLLFTGYKLNIASRIMPDGIGGDALQSATRDLSDGNTVLYRVSPGFQTQNGVRGVRADVILPVPLCQDGLDVMTLLSISACKADGTAAELEADGKTRYPLSDFVEGASGSFTVSRERLDNWMSGQEYTGDPLIGKCMVIRPASSDNLSLTMDESGRVFCTEYTGSDTQKWKILRNGDAYTLQNAASGKVLSCGAIGTLADGKPVISAGNNADSMPVRFAIGRDGSGRYRITSCGDGRYAVELRNSGSESAVVMSDAGDASGQLWAFTPTEESGEGIVIRLEDLDDAKGMPGFYLTYAYNKALLTRDSSIRQTAYIAGDGSITAPTAANGHVSSTALSFTETHANVLKETVDLSSVRLTDLNRGKTIRYTISYTNHYDEDHELNLTDVLPHCQDDDGSELKEGTVIRVKSVSASGDAGSALTVSTPREAEESGSIRVHALLKSGETAEVVFEITVTGAAAKNVLRNSCTQDDVYGQVASNRVETVITGMEGSAEIRKQVSRVSNDIGEIHRWTITASIPEDMYADEDVVYEITDLIDPDEKRLDYKGHASVRLIKAELGSTNEETRTGPEEEAEDLIKGADYVLSEPEEGETGGRLVVSMTEEGEQKLADCAGRGYAVQVLFESAINERAEAGVPIPNHAGLRYGLKQDDGGGEETLSSAENPEPDPYVYTGDIALLKKSDRTGKPIGGASFGLYLDKRLEATAVKNGRPFSVTAADDGTACFHGVKDGTYYVAETSAGEGHMLLAEPFKVVVKNGKAGKNGRIEVRNAGHVHLQAGGSGTAGFAALSALFLLAAVYPVMRRIRRMRRVRSVRSVRSRKRHGG